MKKIFYSYGMLLLAGILSLWALVLEPSCTPQARTAALDDGIKIALCVAANQDLPTEQVLAKCAIESVKTEDVLKLLEETRKATARAAMKAACAPPQADAGAKAASSGDGGK